MRSEPGSEATSLHIGPVRTFAFVAFVVILPGLAYLALLLVTSALHPDRFPFPYALPIFATPFVLVAMGAGFVGLERYRRRKARDHSLLQDFSRRLLEATAEDTILHQAVRVTHDLLEADYVGLFLFDPQAGGLRLEACNGWEPATGGVVTLSPSADQLIGHAFLHDETVQVPDWSRQPRFSPPPYLIEQGVRAGLVVPLSIRKQPVGVLGAYYRRPRSFSDERIRCLSSIAHQATLALEKVRLHAELQANLQRLQEVQVELMQADKLKALGTLLSGMAHELNNPLSSILLAAQRLKHQHMVPAQVQQRLDVIERQAERASRIIGDLRVFARRKPPERRRVDVNEVVQGVLTLQAPDFDFHNIRVVRDLEPGLPAIWADSHQLQQVFLNLFTNATHAMKSAHGQGTLTVRSWPEGSEVYVQVDDTGGGIPPEHLEHIFDPFFTTKGGSEGTGLGLSLSCGIVEAHGGHMQAHNLPDAGARFTVSLPIGEGLEPSAPPAPDSLPASGQARVLIVDDEEPFRTLLAELISALGHQVEEAATGHEAIASLERQSYDLVTLDIRLPDLDGTEIWRWVLARHAALASRVVFMTGDIMTPETETFLQDAGRPVLTKPLTTAQVQQIVDEVLTRNVSQASRAI